MKVISEKQRKTREKYAKKGLISNKILVYMLIFLFVSSFFVFSDNIAKATNSTDNVLLMLNPIQNNIKKATQVVDINGIDVSITPIAEYSIAGRVVESYDYTSSAAAFRNIISGKDNYNDIAIKDVAIAYGPMALTENHRKMTYVMSGSRRITYAVNDNSLFASVGDIDIVKSYITNNHLIVANKEVEELVKKIDKDDYIQISGYLVNATWEEGIYKYALESSLSRYDVGSGACEVLYVVDVKWIK